MIEIEFRFLYMGKILSWEQVKYNTDRGLFPSYFDVFNREEFKKMRYTGVKDKENTKIYEEDIVTNYNKTNFELYGSNNIGIVRFGDGVYDGGAYRYRGFYVGSIDGKSFFEDGLELYDEDIKVLGSTCLNPELLKEGQK